jgi:hypothetical protein
MILLGVNLILFCLTAMQLRRQRRESRRVFSGANSSVQGQQDKDQIKMYLKLFLLMAITSVNMIIYVVSWAYDTGHTNTINYIGNFLRGPLIFWFCIWSREKVRKAFLGVFTCCRKRPKVQQTASMDLSSMDTSISVTNAGGSHVQQQAKCT